MAFASSSSIAATPVVGHLQQDKPDLVILDLGLPGRDGFAVCKELRNLSSLPILILTARNNDIDHVVGPRARCG